MREIIAVKGIFPAGAPVAVLVACLVLAGLASADAGTADDAAAPGARVVEMLPEYGVRQRVLVFGPAKAEKAIVLLPGGSGKVGISPSGALKHDKNFVVRTREAWSALGFRRITPSSIGRR